MAFIVCRAESFLNFKKFLQKLYGSFYVKGFDRDEAFSLIFIL